MGNPLDIGDDREPLPAGEVLHSNLEIFHDRIGVNASKIASKLVIDTKTIVAGESLLDRWNEGRNIVVLRYLSSTREGDDIFGKPLQLCDHLRSPLDQFLAAPITTAIVKSEYLLTDRSVNSN